MSDGSPPVKLIILGGAAEVGKNMFLLEYEGDIIICDCGVGFPGEDQPGIDLVLPDITYLREHRDRIRAIFITHGHEDHIGGLPYLLPEINAPLYATKLTLGLIRVKLQEAGILDQADLREIDPDQWDPIRAGVFQVEPFRVCHSIPDAVGYGITTPAGLIVHTSDFKFDPTPIDGRKTDYEKLRSFRERGVRLLMSDCVHIETTGRTPSELVVGETYDQVFAEAGGRILIATFASLIARIQQVIDTAAVYGRRVATLGRSLENNVRVAMELGYLSDPDRVLVEPKEAAMLPDNQVVYIVTGSQGEPMAVLSRIANGDHREVEVGPGDTVVISATPIPGNETSVFRIINHLFRAGAEVLYPARALVHVSGHASREELREMIDLLQPRDVLPFHGEHRHMALYADLAIEQGIPVDHITFAEIGDVVEITSERVEVNERIDAGYVYVDGGSVGEVGESVIRDRRALSRDGILMVVVSVDRETGEIVAGPEILTRGFIHVKESHALLKATKAHIRQELEMELALDDHHRSEDWTYLSRRLREITSSYLYHETRRRPMILPMVLDV
ncbi:MAG TPA: ribonuclease J [Thermomicrobiales bacterium]|nr:ribonuclease J [Thermomicrobiales bacterium]